MKSKKHRIKETIIDILWVFFSLVGGILLIPAILLFTIILIITRIINPNAEILNDDYEDWRTHG